MALVALPPSIKSTPRKFNCASSKWVSLRSAKACSHAVGHQGPSDLD